MNEIIGSDMSEGQGSEKQLGENDDLGLLSTGCRSRMI